MEIKTVVMHKANMSRSIVQSITQTNKQTNKNIICTFLHAFILLVKNFDSYSC